jgi:hypothetical protein
MNAPEPGVNGGTWLSSLVCTRRTGQAFVRAEV